LSGAALLAIASASGALAKDSGRFAGGRLHHDTALQAYEGLASGASEVNVTNKPAKL